MEREVGGGIAMGNTCKPMAVSFPCMTKFTTKKKLCFFFFCFCLLFKILLGVLGKRRRFQVVARETDKKS